MESIKPRVVFADDDEELRGTLARSLEASGYHVVELEDGFELSDYLELEHPPSARRRQPDLVITDLRMPGPGALELMREARKVGVTTPVMVLTAYGDDGLRQATRDLAWAVLVDKPAPHTEVLEQVSRLLRPPRPEWKPRVLVADDDDDLRELICSALRESGCAVEEARDGLELNARLLADPKDRPALDLVITDERMPWSSGLDVLEQFKRFGWKPTFILITSRTDARTRDRAEVLGAARVFTKPFTLSELVSASWAATRHRAAAHTT
jgi:DNA-binding response OmpR family regulator